MVEGYSDKIEILGADGATPHTAWLTKTDVHLAGTPLQHVDDPEWRYLNHKTNQEGNGEWLYYRTSNGIDISHTKIHCHYNVAPPGPGAGPYIWSECEHINQYNVPDNEPDHKHCLIFMGHDGLVWRADIQNVTNFPGQPIFLLKRL